MSSYAIISESTQEIVSLDAVKLHCRIDGDDENDLLYSLITAARQTVENRTWMILKESVARIYFDKGEVTDFIRINKSPIRSIAGVYYKDANGNTQTLSAQNYEVDLFSNPVRIKIKTMPDIGDYMNAFWVEFNAGYLEVSQVPVPIIQALLLIIGHLYEHREDVMVANNYSLTNGSLYLLNPYMQPAFFI